MGEWHTTSLGELVVSHDSRRRPVKSSDRRPGPYPYYGASGIVDFVDSYLFDGELLLVAEDGENLRSRQTPVAFMATGRFWVNNHAHVLEANDLADTWFLSYALQSTDIEAFISGSAIPKLTQGNLNRIPVMAPPRRHQRAVTAALRALDDKIELNRRMAATLEEMARALFKSWFVDFDPVRAKAEGSDTGLPSEIADLFPDRLVDSHLGEIPDGWTTAGLGEVVTELEVGGRPKGGVSAYTDGVPSIGAESIVGLGRFDFNKTKFVPRDYFVQMRKGHVQSRDVLLYKDGGKPGQFEPHVSMFGDGFPFRECAINEHVYRIRAKPDLTQEFLYFWLRSDQLMDEMRRKGTGVAIPGLNSTQVRSLSVLVPEPGVLKAFNSRAEPLVGRVLALAVQTQTLSELRDAVLPRLVSGEIRISDPEDFLARMEAVG